MTENGDIIYLDNAATSWPKPAGMAEAMADFIKQGCANPGRSGHRMSIDTARMIFSVRDSIAELFGCSDPLRIAFTSNATSALNTAITGLIKPGDHVITTGMEHNSVMRPLRTLEADGAEVSVIQCASDGTINPDDIKKNIRKNTKAVVMTHASNVTGTIMPVEDAAAITRENGILLIVDAAQTAGTVPINVMSSGIDILAFTGHKGFYGPQGTGGLYIRQGLEDLIKPIMAGGTGSRSEKEEQPDFMPDKFESGTPNSPGLAGLGAALNFIRETGIDAVRQKESFLTNKFIEGLQSVKGITLYGLADSSERTSVISINIKGKSASEVSQQLDEDFNIMTRPGLHCAPAAHKSIGTFPGGTVRFSIGYFNTEEQIAEAVRAVEIIARG